MIFETSWDDGSKEDLKIAELLKKYKLPGTFYITIDWVGTENHLTWEDIKQLVKEGFEIGSHTMTHPQDMKLLYDDQLFFEVQTSKDLLERALGIERIKKFCYPRGRYNEKTIEAVKQAGYEEARTTIVGDIFVPDKYKKNTSVHVYEHRKEYDGQGWFEYAKLVYKEAELYSKNNSVFHLWGHSWEIGRDKEWKKLEEFFKYASENTKKKN